MIPVAIIYFAETIVPESIIKAVVALVPTWAIAGPITSLLLAYGLAFVPMGARLIVQIASGHTDNQDPAGNKQKLLATNKLASRLNSAHYNLLEGYPFFATGVLACMHVGVPQPLLNMYCTVHFLLSAAFVVIYAIQVAEPLPTLRTLTWALRTAVQAKLFYLAIHTSMSSK